MARISVSVPEELLAKLEPVKESINISQVCRDALERRIQLFERAGSVESEAVDLESLVDRLRDERVLVEGRFEELGRHNAESWVGKAAYLDLKAVTETNGALDMGKYRLPSSSFKTMKRDMESERVTVEGPQAITYKAAWLDQVRTLWAHVMEQLETEAETADSA
jgi:hypothetical protein